VAPVGLGVDYGTFEANASTRSLTGHVQKDGRSSRWTVAPSVLGTSVALGVPEIPRDDEVVASEHD
jgi:hypothetical protein